MNIPTNPTQLSNDQARTTIQMIEDAPYAVGAMKALNLPDYRDWAPRLIDRLAEARPDLVATVDRLRDHIRPADAPAA